MDGNEFREYLKKRDAETLEDRVKRRSELSPAAYVGEMPRLLWEYSAEAIHLYICGHFPAVILWCASILELALEDKLIASGKGTGEVIELLSLAEKTRLCRKFRIITAGDKKGIDRMRDLRNSITHANAGRLGEMARAHYSDVGGALSDVLPSLYLGDFGSTISSKALEVLSFSRELIKQWYGEKIA